MLHLRAHLLAFGALLAASTAFAQPGAGARTPVPAPTSEPAPEPVPSVEPPPLFVHRFPFTVEAGFNIGGVRVPGSFDTSRFDVPLIGFHAGAGAWLTPRLAVSALFSGAGYNHAAADDRSNYRHGFVGPIAQYWFNDWLWASAGPGLALVYRKLPGQDGATSSGIAADLRIGRSFQPVDATHQLELTLEATLSHYTIADATKNYQLVLINIGYQLL